MFQLYTGNKLEDLSVLLAKILSVSPPKNVFQSECILVQTPGMAQWLNIRLAELMTVSAGVDFPLPSSFVWRVFQSALDDIPAQSAFNKPYLTWRLMRILERFEDNDAFSDLSNYLAEDGSQVRRYQLCATVADIYDQYLVYRPDWISAWESNQEDSLPLKLREKFEAQPWQAILWRELMADISHDGMSLYHRANLLEALADMTKSQPRPSSVPERIFIFGVSSLPPNTLNALQVLANSGWIEMHLFLQNPCRFYWGDVVDKHFVGRAIKRQTLKPGMQTNMLHLDANPLLASWGRLGRDYIAQLQDVADAELEIFDDYLLDGLDENQISLLHRVQQDVFTMENHGAKEERELVATAEYRHTVAASDRSVQVHVCHSPLREVEVLHDQLLALFETNPDLTPKDVIVMLPDVNRYSPYVKAVFSQKVFQNAGGHRASGSSIAQPQNRIGQSIPFVLIDQSGGLENPVVDAFLYLLGLGDSRFTLSELISILEVPAVMAKFDLTVEELERVRQWATEVGVRWGLTEETATQHDLPKQTIHTWHHGLKRMLLGYSVGHDHIWQDILSYGDIEGLEASIAGKLADFLDKLQASATHFSQSQSPEGWISTLNALLADYFELTDEDPFRSLFTRHLNTLQEEWQGANFHDDIEFPVIREVLAPRLQESSGSHRFLAGRVNFCTLMPMRSVPFKVICVLGMNEGDYPRNAVPMGFDLMVGDYRSGDRSPREDDKYLFLEALMSARDTFYLSYVGRSVQDNSEKNPSIILSELVEYIGQSCTLERDRLKEPDVSTQNMVSHVVTEHPLQPFNADYYSASPLLTDNESLFSYNEQWLPLFYLENVYGEKFDSFSFEPLTDYDGDLSELDVDELRRFFRHPARYFTQKRLRAYLSFNEEDELEDEPFALTGLSGYQIKVELLEAMLKDEEAELIARLPFTGNLPSGSMGKVAFDEVVQQCRGLSEAVKSHGVEALPDQEVDLTLTTEAGTSRITGWLPMTNATMRVSYRLGDLTANQKIVHWLEHLLLSAQGTPKRHVFVNDVKGKVKTLEFSAVTPDDAQLQLQIMLTLLNNGLRMPQLLPAKSSDAWCASYLNKKALECEETAFSKSLETYQELDDEYHSVEVSDPYWQRFYPNLSAHRAAFEQNVRAIWLPLHHHLKPLEDKA
ncbi:exodeoxyribonuclease V subunit gamma [Marinomonas mediterranea]|uniref:exodeoxyribonuclease V subunit gamma n=1 Tax=Marinomonas mediterranea TaxID=119864 RepID=UPI00234AA2B7|nr:exodeoxyribonuclease V subunit gamma [Marinomonas mediterranea]WCN09966.1 exodeoxyribonuclease V subunit gamma [Marinomonas mediterranea]